MDHDALNVLGEPLQACSFDPLTGFYRDGCCHTGPDDVGTHVVCARVTAEFLAFSQAVGNDLSTPRPEWRFAGLKPQAQYRLTLAWPSQLKEYSPSVLQVVPGEIFSGEALQQFGLQMPILHPQSSLIFVLEQQGG